MNKKPFILAVIDGLGATSPNKGNAVTLAKPKNLIEIWQKYPSTYLYASGKYVGLPDGVMGNSEVGHLSIGAGKVMLQEIARIDHDIQEGNFFKNPTFLEAIEHAQKNNTNFHLMGVTGGNVHAAVPHLLACLKLLSQEKFPGERVFIHAFTDGRDAPPNSAEKYLKDVEAETKKLGVGRIESIIGRYYAMDRDERWERTKLVYDLITTGAGEKVESYKKALEVSYARNESDEYIKPFVIEDSSHPFTPIKNGDVVLFFNFRADRAVQLSKAFEDKGFNKFPVVAKDAYFVGFSNYEKGVNMNRAKDDLEDYKKEGEMVKELFKEELQKSDSFPKRQIFPPEKVKGSLGEILSNSGLKQLRITESEKYPHVTYFFSGREKDAFKGEERIEIPSPRDVATYDKKPEMSAREVTRELVKQIEKGGFDFILVNYALTDMVAHTGSLEASIKAVSVADECIGEVRKAISNVGGEMLVTADHGNIEELVDMQTGEMDTKHSTNPVPITYITNRGFSVREVPTGMLADIAPTILAALGLPIPQDMTGRNLFEGVVF